MAESRPSPSLPVPIRASFLISSLDLLAVDESAATSSAACFIQIPLNYRRILARHWSKALGLRVALRQLRSAGRRQKSCDALSACAPDNPWPPRARSKGRFTSRLCLGCRKRVTRFLPPAGASELAQGNAQA